MPPIYTVLSYLTGIGVVLIAVGAALLVISAGSKFFAENLGPEFRFREGLRRISSRRVAVLYSTVLFIGILLAIVSPILVQLAVSESDYEHEALRLADLDTPPEADEYAAVAIKINHNLRDEMTRTYGEVAWERPFPWFIRPFHTYVSSVLGLGEHADWVLATKMGNCGEHSDVYFKLLDSIGIPTRKVSAPADDHNWNEVYINGTWTHSDPSAGSREDFAFNSCSAYENVYSWDLSKVYYLDSEGEKHDIAEKYTATGNLSVSGEFSPDTRVTVKNNRTKGVVETEEAGPDREVTIENLGDGPYRVLVEEPTFTFVGYRVQKDVRVGENQTTFSTVTPTEFGLLSNSPQWIFGIMILMAIPTYYSLFRQFKMNYR